MSKWIIFLLVICNIFAQEENFEKMKSSFISTIKSGEIENTLPYLESLLHHDIQSTKWVIGLLWENQKVFFHNKNKKLVSSTLCPVILDLLQHQATDVELDIMMFKILSLLDLDVILSSQSQVFGLVNDQNFRDEPFLQNFMEYFFLQMDENFLEVAVLEIKQDKNYSKLIQSIFSYCTTEYFFKQKTLPNIANIDEKILTILYLYSIYEINHIKVQEIVLEILDNENVTHTEYL